MRTLKCHIEAETGLEIDKMVDLMSWVVRWSGELITRYHIGKDKETAYERIRGKACNRPACQVSESVLYMPFDSPQTDENKSEARMREGIWLGANERTEETIIGTNVGVVKCRTIQRKPEGSQWNAAQLMETKGSAQQLVLGLATDKIPTAITGEDKRLVKPRTYAQEKPRCIPDKPATGMTSAARALKIFKKDVEKYDPTLGCRECTDVITGRDANRESITQSTPHSNDCRARMIELMRRDDTHKARGDKV